LLDRRLLYVEKANVGQGTRIHAKRKDDVPKTSVNPKVFNTLVVKQVAHTLGVVLDNLKQIRKFEADRQAAVEGFYRDILEHIRRCADEIERLEK